MPTLLVRCAQCGIEYTPDPKDLLRGTWRVCTTCRSTPPSAKADPTPAVRPSPALSHATETTP